MKRLFSLVTLCLFVAFEASATVYVCSQEIKKGNSYTSLSGGTIKSTTSGKTAKVSRSGNTITIEYAEIECSADHSAMRVEEDGITIKFVGKCTITATKSGRDGLQINSSNINTTIQGDGLSTNVTLKGRDSGLFIEKKCNLTVRNISLTCDGGNNGIDGNDGKNSETLTVDGKNVYIKATSTSSTTINDMAKIDFTNSSYTDSDQTFTSFYNWCHLDKDSHKVCDASGSTVSKGTVEIGKHTLYGLNVAGNNVTDHNYAKLGTWLSSQRYVQSDASSVSYTPSSKTLRLKNCSSIFNKIVDNSRVDGLKIVIEGNNTFDGGHALACFVSSKPFSIEGATSDYGQNKLTIGYPTSSASMDFGYAAILAIRSKLTVRNVTMNVRGGTYGIAGVEQAELEVRYSSVKATAVEETASNAAAIGSFENANFGKKIYFYDCDIKTTGCFISSALKGIANISGLVKDVTIVPITTSYGQYIMGRQLNNLNCNSFACEGMTSGTIKYDDSSGTLTLNNVNMNSPAAFTGNAIDEYIPNHIKKISLAGNNKLTAYGNVFSISGNVTFTGGAASLKAVSTSSYGYYTLNEQSQKSPNIVINVGGEVSFIGSKGGFRGAAGNGDTGFTTKLELNKSNANSVYRFGGADAAVWGISTLAMEYMDFYSGSTGTPGCFFNNYFIRQNGGNIVKGTNVVEFRPVTTTYNLSVGGTPVTNCNMLGIGSKYISSGGGTAAVYDHSTSTLKLNNAVINTGSNAVNGIRNNGMYLKINATSSSITSNNANSTGVAIYCSMDTQINGSLDLKGNAGGIIGNNDACIWFNDCTMNISDGISGYDGKALLRVTLPTQGRKVVVGKRVEALSDLILETGKITKPVGGKFDKNVHAVVDQNGNKANGVTFEDRYATAIDAIEVANDTEAKQIFDATGRESNTAKRGLNIIRMSDGTVRKVMVK